MNDELLNFINSHLKSENVYSMYSTESSIKQGIILPVLSYLGWDIFNIQEVYPEYSINGKYVDYILRYKGSNKVVIEVKNCKEDLGKHEEQIYKYSSRAGAKIAVLTNGVSWWFYLIHLEDIWESRKFYSIDILDQDKNEITQKFTDFLSKKNVVEGMSVELANQEYTSKKRDEEIKKTLPKAWNKIISEPDEKLIELISETTENLSGYKPKDETVKEFIKTNVNNIQESTTIISNVPQKKPIVQKEVQKQPLYESYHSETNFWDKLTNEQKDIMNSLIEKINELGDTKIMVDFPHKEHFSIKYDGNSWMVIKPSKKHLTWYIRIDPATFHDPKYLSATFKDAERYGNRKIKIDKNTYRQYFDDILYLIKQSYEFRKKNNYKELYSQAVYNEFGIII